MESIKNTPNYIHKEGDNDALKKELNIALEKELEKSPDEIDTDKIDSMILLLEKLDGGSLQYNSAKDKGIFAKQYLAEYIREPSKSESPAKSPVRIRFAYASFALLLLFLGVNYISVRATQKGIFSNVRETIEVFYFDVIKRNATEVENQEELSPSQEIVELANTTFNTWNEAQVASGYSFKYPQYIPPGFQEGEIHFQKITASDFILSRSYYQEEQYIRFFIRSFDNEAKLSSFIDDRGSILYEKSINGFFVTCYQIEENLQAIFQEDLFIYGLETNLTEETLEEIIMKVRNETYED